MGVEPVALHLEAAGQVDLPDALERQLRQEVVRRLPGEVRQDADEDPERGARQGAAGRRAEGRRTSPGRGPRPGTWQLAREGRQGGQGRGGCKGTSRMRTLP